MNVTGAKADNAPQNQTLAVTLAIPTNSGHDHHKRCYVTRQCRLLCLVLYGANSDLWTNTKYYPDSQRLHHRTAIHLTCKTVTNSVEEYKAPNETTMQAWGVGLGFVQFTGNLSIVHDFSGLELHLYNIFHCICWRPHKVLSNGNRVTILLSYFKWGRWFLVIHRDGFKTPLSNVRISTISPSPTWYFSYFAV